VGVISPVDEVFFVDCDGTVWKLRVRWPITSQVDERWTASGNGEDRVGVETLAARHR
jgi:hypothetical protein